MTIDETTKKLQEAEKHAEKGDAILMDTILKLNFEDSDETREDTFFYINRIRTKGYNNAIPKKLNHTKYHSEKGEILQMESEIYSIEKYAYFLGIDVAEDINSIKINGYKKAIPKKLNLANQFAEEGDAKMMDTYLEKVTKLSYETGEEIPEIFNEIKNKGYRRAIPKRLKMTKEYAKEGKVCSMESEVQQTKEYAFAVGVNIPEDVNAIRNSGYRNAIRKEFFPANHYAKGGQTD